MTDELTLKIIAALRDTAAKTSETKVIENGGVDQFYARSGVPSIQYVEKYSRDWIAGRLLGMADTIEALSKGSLT